MLFDHLRDVNNSDLFDDAITILDHRYFHDFLDYYFFVLNDWHFDYNLHVYDDRNLNNSLDNSISVLNNGHFDSFFDNTVLELDRTGNLDGHSFNAINVFDNGLYYFYLL